MPLPPSVQLHRYRVTDNHPIADGRFGLKLEAVDEPIPSFQAGQWVSLHLLNDDGSEWGKAPFSIANAPAESERGIELGIKVKGDFTKRARQLPVGAVVMLQGPWGVFTLRKDVPRAVMFAAGIGIAPLRSMIREACLSHLTIDIVLFYSVSTRANAAYLDELHEFAGVCPYLRIIPVITREPNASGNAEVRRIDAQMLDAHIKDYSIGEYLMCGPNEFMDSMRTLLMEKGVEKQRIRSERFE
jgi:ferredoxin-NADP reductase